MRTTLFPLFCLLAAAALSLSACNLPVAATATLPAAAESPSATLTMTTESTATRQEAVPSETPTLPTPAALVEASATSTPEAPQAKVVRESNCRTGPAGDYDLVATYPVGQMLELVARDLGAGYWFVRNPQKPEEQCYLLAQNITIQGDPSALPKFTPLPSPTEAPYFKVSFKKFDTCKGADFAIFNVENTGSVPFRSAYIKVTDQKNGQSVEQALNAFDLHVGCTLAKNISPLDPGVTGTVESPPFTWAARSHRLRAILMLCTEKDLKGTCVTQVLEVKP